MSFYNNLFSLALFLFCLEWDETLSRETWDQSRKRKRRILYSIQHGGRNLMLCKQNDDEIYDCE